MTDVEAAWLAGLIDGEGCIWGRWPKKKNVIVEISMTHKPTLERVQQLFPGRFAKKIIGRGSLSLKPQWCWRTDTNGTRTLLRALLPYLVTKRREAEIALELCARPVNPIRFDALTVEMKALR